ncbi:TolC family protein [Cytophaga aurantiaca]|uniref:TolC family protein n=1 Tax=Cytophaga aurantiaca TaxID=29530 RepID=UPI000381D3A4|nr:TolC family protein [Cytophaga aurantiaca]
MSKKYLLLVLLLVQMSDILAQQRPVEPLQLADALADALEYNQSIAQASLDQDIAKSQYGSSTAAFLPQVNLSYTSTLTNNPLMVFGNKMVQGVVTQNDFNPVLLNNPSDYQNHNAMVSIVQPILNPDILFQRRAAQMQQEVYGFKKEHTKAYVSFEVKKTYYQLLLNYNALGVLQNVLKTTEEAYKTVSNFYQQGLVSKADVLNAQVFKSSIESQLLETQNSIDGLSDQLSLLMNKEPKTNYTVQVDSSYTTTLDLNSFQYNEKRADFMAYNKAVESYNKMIQASKFGISPRLNAFGNYQANSNTFGFGNGSYFIGLQVSMDVFKGLTNYHQVATQTYQRNKMMLELKTQQIQTQVDIEKSKRDLHDIQLRMQQTNTSIEQAKEALKLTQERYNEGLVKTTDLLTSQNLLAQQELALSKLYFEYNVTISYLTFLTNQNQ